MVVEGRVRKNMESYLNEHFDLSSKNPTDEALQRWRKLRGVVKNPKRWFRFTANLSKRMEAQAMRRTNQGSRQSFQSFGSTDEIYRQDAREIHLGHPISFSSPSITIRERSSPLVTDVVLDFGHDQEVGPTAEPTASEKQNVPQPWAKVIAVMAFTSVVGLLSVSYTINGNGNLTPATLFSGRPVSFGFFLLVVMVTFYISIIAMIIQPVLPLIAKVLNIMAFVCVVLGVTVLLWAMLPKSISWVPWTFFAVTILIAFGVIVYESFVYVKKVKEKGTTIRPTT